jgi:hypothetical protein
VSAPADGPVLVIGVYGVRHDQLGADLTPAIWSLGQAGFLAPVILDQGGHGGREPEVTTAWAAAAGPGIRPGGPPLITRQVQVPPLVLAALGDPG